MKKLLLTATVLFTLSSCVSSEKNREPNQIVDLGGKSFQGNAAWQSHFQPQVIYSEYKIISEENIASIIRNRAEPATTRYLVIQSKGTVSNRYCYVKSEIIHDIQKNQRAYFYEQRVSNAPLSTIIKIGDESDLKGNTFISSGLCNSSDSSNEVIGYEYNGKGEILQAQKAKGLYSDKNDFYIKYFMSEY